jgi:DNA polymerase V
MGSFRCPPRSGSRSEIRRGQGPGIENGDPWFKLKADPRLKELIAKSSNYELYGHLSSRVMELIGRYSYLIEVYFIDEAFAVLRGEPQELERVGREIKVAVTRHVGLPVCVGMRRRRPWQSSPRELPSRTLPSEGVCPPATK